MAHGLTNFMRLAVIGYVLLFVLNSCSRGKAYNVPGCSDVWDGKFYHMKGGETALEILRKDDVQIERTNDGAEYKFKVQWLDSCRYRLTQISTDKSETAKHFEPVVCQITAVTRSSYKVVGWIEGTTLNTYSTEIFRAAN